MANSTRKLSPAYAKRLASAMARGKTRQEARGHKRGEAAQRKERERAERGISSYDERSIRAWCERFRNEGRDTEDVIEEAQSKGYDWFVNYRDTWNAARRAYLRESKAGEYSSRGMGYLEYLAGQADVSDIAWLYYH